MAGAAIPYSRAELLERGVGSETRRRWLIEAILDCSERIAATLSDAQEKERRDTASDRSPVAGGRKE